jgi:hypothetical protein
MTGCGAANNQASQATSFNLGESQIASFNLSNWYPSCVTGSGCWHDFVNDAGSWSVQFQFSYDSGDYAAKTNGSIAFICNNGISSSQQIPSEIIPGWKSEWIRNPCPGKLTKITTRAGLNGTWGTGTLSLWQKVL